MVGQVEYLGQAGMWYITAQGDQRPQGPCADNAVTLLLKTKKNYY